MKALTLASKFLESLKPNISNTFKEVVNNVLYQRPDYPIWVKGIVSDHQFSFMPKGYMVPITINRGYLSDAPQQDDKYRLYLNNEGDVEFTRTHKELVKNDPTYGPYMLGTIVGQQIVFNQPAHNKKVVLNIPQHVKGAQSICESGWVQLFVPKSIVDKYELVFQSQET